MFRASDSSHSRARCLSENDSSVGTYKGGSQTRTGQSIDQNQPAKVSGGELVSSADSAVHIVNAAHSSQDRFKAYAARLTFLGIVIIGYSHWSPWMTVATLIGSAMIVAGIGILLWPSSPERSA